VQRGSHRSPSRGVRPAEPVVRDAWDEVTGDVHVLAADDEAQAVGQPAVFGNSRVPARSLRGVLFDPGVRFACDDPSITTASLEDASFHEGALVAWHRRRRHMATIQDRLGHACFEASHDNDSASLSPGPAGRFLCFRCQGVGFAVGQPSRPDATVRASTMPGARGPRTSIRCCSALRRARVSDLGSSPAAAWSWLLCARRTDGE
jgi:hypothetical protein